MKYFVLMIASILLTVSMTLPQHKTENININGPVDIYTKKNTGSVIEINEKKGMVVLNDFFKIEENERIWVTIGSKQMMVYRHIDNYIYIDGYFHPIDGKWHREEYRVKKEDIIDLFQLQLIEGNEYGTAAQKQSQICSKLPSDKEIVEMMDNVNLPIFGAHITKMSEQLPGAERAYRNGYHEGFDWYSGAIGTEITKDTKVYPMYEGKVIRIDKNYEELKLSERNKILEDEATTENKKYQLNLDKLRGMQVWVQSENGVMVRYAHMDSVNGGIDVGDTVKIDEYIGTTGNSGTSNGVLETEGDIHLHTDILVCGKNFWEYGNIEKMNENVIEMFEKE